MPLAVALAAVLVTRVKRVQARDHGDWASLQIGDWAFRKAIAIEKEVEWPRRGVSLYFRDPAGNLVELVTPGFWGSPSGW
jgi:hypothetical protein